MSEVKHKHTLGAELTAEAIALCQKAASEIAHLVEEEADISIPLHARASIGAIIEECVETAIARAALANAEESHATS